VQASVTREILSQKNVFKRLAGPGLGLRKVQPGVREWVRFQKKRFFREKVVGIYAVWKLQAKKVGRSLSRCAAKKSVQGEINCWHWIGKGNDNGGGVALMEGERGQVKKEKREMEVSRRGKGVQSHY